MPPFAKSNRDPLRCLNPACPSKRRGDRRGTLLLETVGGVFFKELGGDKVAGLFWLFVECGTCGARRYNPAAVAFDGMGKAIEMTMQAAAKRGNDIANADHDDEPPRRPKAA